MFESGLEFLRADFHLHTQKDKEFSYSGEPNDFVKSYISALNKLIFLLELLPIIINLTKMNIKP